MLNIDRLKRKLFTKKFASQNGDLKSGWKTINTALNKKTKTTQVATLEVDGSLISDSNSIVESMNNFFCSIGNTLEARYLKHLIYVWKISARLTHKIYALNSRQSVSVS